LDYQATREDDGMPTNEEGEFELVLGNKQLLSVFFVAVLLLGVFFIMGYIVGRNLSPEPALIAEGTRGTGVIDVETVTPPATAKPLTPDPEKPGAMPTVTPVTPATKPVEVPKPVAAAKLVEAPKKAEVKSVEAPKKVDAPKKAEVVKPVVPAPKPVETPKPVATPTKGGGDRYWQVAAAVPGKVQGLVSGLTAKGFKVTTQPVPGQELVRVLVGPYDAAGAADGGAKLKEAGYAAIPKKL
jgi:outer membrane biosynthesis protein TonB